MLPHSLHKRILSRIVFYSCVAVIALVMRIATPEPNADQSKEASPEVHESEVARAYYAFPSSQ